MRVKPTTGPELVIEGGFSFSAKRNDGIEITDSYRLRLVVPQSFPKDLPSVTELDLRIPRIPGYHVNPDGSLCLGSPLRLLYKLSRAPSLCGFASSCIVPYLYAISHKSKHGGPLPFSELAHGTPGEVQDYAELFLLSRPEQVRQALRVLGMKKRIANKENCPCGCGKRLGNCRFNRTIRKFRRLASRSWYLSHQIKPGG
jgi:hypothetical protein